MGHLATTFTDDLRAAANERPPDWTRRWNDQSLDAYVDFPTGANNVGPHVMFLESSNDFSSFASLLSWDRFDRPEHQSADCDCLLLFQYLTGPASVDGFMITARASGATGSNNAYVFRQRQTGEAFELLEWTNDVETILGAIDLPFTITALNWYWLQLRCTGDQIKARIWEYTAPGPINWKQGVEVTNSAHTAAGWVGFGSSHGDDTEIDFFHVAVDGEFAQLPQQHPVFGPGLTATPSRIHEDGSSFLVFVGEPNRTVQWLITGGDGSLTVIGEETDNAGQATAVYTPGTVDTIATVEVTYGT